jgi:hypothetical protein
VLKLGSQLVSQVGVSYAAYAGLRLVTGPWVLGTHRHGLGHKKAEAWARVSGGCARGKCGKEPLAVRSLHVRSSGVRVRGSQVGIKALGAGNLSTWLG